MKKIMLIGASLTLMALAGCGQNVDGIKAEFASKTNKSAEQDFAGYGVIYTAEELKAAKKFGRDNRVSSNVEFDKDGNPLPLAEPDFKGKGYEKASELHAKMLKRYAAIQDEASEAASNVKREYEATINGHEDKLKQYQESMSEYNALIAEEQVALQEASKERNAWEDKIKAREEKLYAEFKQAVIENELPIDANKKVNASRYYRTGNQARCETFDASVKMTLKNPTKGRYCVYSTLNESQASLNPSFLSYGVDYYALDEKRDAAKDVEKAASNALRNAKVVASNKTSVDVRNVERNIRNEERKIERAKSDMEYKTDVSRIAQRLVSDDDALRELRSEFDRAIREHNKDAQFEGIKESGYDFISFDDEEEVVELEEDEVIFVAYVFTDEDEKQSVYFSAMRGKDKPVSYGDLFSSKVRRVNLDFEVDGESGVLQIMKETM